MSLIAKVLPPLTTSRTVVDALGNVLDPGIRLYISKVFFLSGLTKIRDWDTTLTLFQDEYHVPVLPHGPGKLSLDAIVWKKLTRAE